MPRRTPVEELQNNEVHTVSSPMRRSSRINSNSAIEKPPSQEETVSKPRTRRASITKDSIAETNKPETPRKPTTRRRSSSVHEDVVEEPARVTTRRRSGSAPKTLEPVENKPLTRIRTRSSETINSPIVSTRAKRRVSTDTVEVLEAIKENDKDQDTSPKTRNRKKSEQSKLDLSIIAETSIHEENLSKVLESEDSFHIPMLDSPVKSNSHNTSSDKENTIPYQEKKTKAIDSHSIQKDNETSQARIDKVEPMEVDDDVFGINFVECTQSESEIEDKLVKVEKFNDQVDKILNAEICNSFSSEAEKEVNSESNKVLSDDDINRCKSVSPHYSLRKPKWTPQSEKVNKTNSPKHTLFKKSLKFEENFDEIKSEEENSPKTDVETHVVPVANNPLNKSLTRGSSNESIQKDDSKTLESSESIIDATFADANSNENSIVEPKSTTASQDISVIKSNKDDDYFETQNNKNVEDIKYESEISPSLEESQKLSPTLRRSPRKRTPAIVDDISLEKTTLEKKTSLEKLNTEISFNKESKDKDTDRQKEDEVETKPNRRESNSITSSSQENNEILNESTVGKRRSESGTPKKSPQEKIESKQIETMNNNPMKIINEDNEIITNTRRSKSQTPKKNIDDKDTDCQNVDEVETKLRKSTSGTSSSQENNEILNESTVTKRRSGSGTPKKSPQDKIESKQIETISNNQMKITNEDNEIITNTRRSKSQTPKKNIDDKDTDRQKVDEVETKPNLRKSSRGTASSQENNEILNESTGAKRRSESGTPKKSPQEKIESKQIETINNNPMKITNEDNEIIANTRRSKSQTPKKNINEKLEPTNENQDLDEVNTSKEMTIERKRSLRKSNSGITAKIVEENINLLEKLENGIKATETTNKAIDPKTAQKSPEKFVKQSSAGEIEEMEEIEIISNANELKNVLNESNVEKESKSKPPIAKPLESSIDVTSKIALETASIEMNDSEKNHSKTKKDSVVRGTKRKFEESSSDEEVEVVEIQYQDEEESVGEEENKSIQADTEAQINEIVIKEKLDESKSPNLKRKSISKNNSINETSHTNQNLEKQAKNIFSPTVKNCASTPKPECKNSPLANKVEQLIQQYITDNVEASDSEIEEKPKNDFVDDMAEEGEEDTPSEGSNDIIDHGESIHSSDSEVVDDESYENDSFIDDEEDHELLSGKDDYYFSSDENSPKKTRIIQLSSGSDTEIVKIEKPKKEKKVKKKRKSRLIKPADSSSEDEETESQETKPNKEKEEVVNDIITECIETVSVEKPEEVPPPSIEIDSPEANSSINRQKSKVIIHENIRVDQLANAELKNRIDKVLDMFCSNIRKKGEVSVNLSFEYDQKTEDAKVMNTSKSANEKNVSGIGVEDVLNTSKLSNKSINKSNNLSSSSSNVFLKESASDENKMQGKTEGKSKKRNKKRKNKNRKKVGIGSNDHENVSNEVKTEQSQEKVKAKKHKLSSPETGIPTKKQVTFTDYKTAVEHQNKLENKKKNRTKIENRASKKNRKVKNKRSNLEDSDNEIANIIDQAVSDNQRRQVISFTTDWVVTEKKLEKIDEWEIKDESLKPSTTNITIKETNKKLKCSTSELPNEFHPRDFKNQMLYNTRRVKRIETKQLLKKRGVNNF